MAKTVGTEKELKESPDAYTIRHWLEKNPNFKSYLDGYKNNKDKGRAIKELKDVKEERAWWKNRKGMATEGGLPFSSERLFNKGGLPKKPKFMKGGSYKGKSHMYAAGGMVKELKI